MGSCVLPTISIASPGISCSGLIVKLTSSNSSVSYGGEWWFSCFWYWYLLMVAACVSKVVLVHGSLVFLVIISTVHGVAKSEQLTWFDVCINPRVDPFVLSRYQMMSWILQVPSPFCSNLVCQLYELQTVAKEKMHLASFSFSVPEGACQQEKYCLLVQLQVSSSGCLGLLILLVHYWHMHGWSR